MQKSTIEKILQIAIENGYNTKNLYLNMYKEHEWKIWWEILFESLITSKDFIDSFCKYLFNNASEIILNLRLRIIKWFWLYDLSSEFKQSFRHKLIDARYNNTLEEFLNSLI